MKRNSIALALLLMITFSACVVGIKYSLPPEITLAPGTDLVQQVGTIAADSLTFTAEPTTPTPFPVSSSLPANSTAQKRYMNSVLGIQFSYPGTWYLQEIAESQPAAIIVTSFDPANPPHKLEWTDQTVSMQIRLQPAGSVHQNLDAWVESARQTAVAAHISIFEEERFQVSNQPASRITLVSGSGGIIHQILTILDGRNYEINIEGNLDLGKSVLNTMHPFTSSGLKPSEGNTPAAGICMETQDEYVAIELGLDQSGMPLAGRCIVLLQAQRIKLINQSDGPMAIQFADYYFDLPEGVEVLLDKPVGEFLAPGVHFLPMGPELWVKEVVATPLATMPGPLQNYSNPEVGYTLTIPPGWNVDEYGLSMPNKEVLFYPVNSEPFLVYLDIGLDPRTLDALKAQDIPNAQKAGIFYAGTAGVQYLYSSGRSEIYLDYHGKIYYLISDKPTDEAVQNMIESFVFIDL